MDCFQRGGFEPVDALAAVASFGDETGVAEDAQMLGNRGLRHVERFEQVVDGAIAHGEEVQDGATRRIGDGTEDGHVDGCDHGRDYI